MSTTTPTKKMFYTIYQPNQEEEGIKLLFLNYERAQKRGLMPSIDHYDKIYSGVMREGETLDDLFYRFNMKIPKDFHGHSLSVSDVIVLKNLDDRQNLFGKAYYVDSIGFKELSDFMPEKYLRYVKDAVIHVFHDDKLYGQFPDENMMVPFKSHIDEIKEGDTFLFHGQMHVAATDAHRSGKEKDAPWIFYDAAGNRFLEKDFDKEFPPYEDTRWIPEELRQGLIFDEEICIQDDLYESVDGYLWATDFLVDKLKAQISNQFYRSAAEAINDIQFYADWNQLTGRIAVKGCFSIYNRSGEEIRLARTLSLSQREKAALCALMDHYCRNTCRVSCLELVNQFRQGLGLSLLPESSIYLQREEKSKAYRLDSLLSEANHRQQMGSQPIKKEKLQR